MGFDQDQSEGDVRFCKHCGKPLTYVSQYDRYYCYDCQEYDDAEGGSFADADIVPERTEYSCSTCGEYLYFIDDYDSHFCYRCNAYQDPEAEGAGDEDYSTEDSGLSEPYGIAETGMDNGIGTGAEAGIGTGDDATCPECGAGVDEEWVRCPECGTHLETDGPFDDGEQGTTAADRMWSSGTERHDDRATSDPTSVEKGSDVPDIPDGHTVDLDHNVEILIGIFEKMFSAYMEEPMEPLSFYRSKLNVLSQRKDSLRKINVGDDGSVNIYSEVNDFEALTKDLVECLDNLIETEGVIINPKEAMARAMDVLEPVVDEYAEELEDLRVLPRILNGAFATRLSSGIPGFDDMLHGGVPNGGSLIVQGATGGEKEMFANQFLAAGLDDGASALVTLSMISPDEWRSQMRAIGARTRKYEKSGKLIMVDWYTHKNERVRSVEFKGPVILSSKSITNLEIALDKAIKQIRDAPTKRAVIAVLSPAIKSLGFDKVYGFAQSIRGKFKKYGITGLFLMEKKMHDEKVESSLHSVFDGVFDIERERVGDAIVRKIGILSMKGHTFESRYKELELTRKGLRVKNK